MVGNEIVDRIAQSATKLNRIAQLPYTRKEAYALVMIQCKRNKSLFPTFQQFPNPHGTFPKLPTEFIILLRRLRIKISPCNYTIFKCKCGERIKYSHIFEKCTGFYIETKDLLHYMQEKDITPGNILIKHTTLGWDPARLLCETIMKTSYSHCF